MNRTSNAISIRKDNLENTDVFPELIYVDTNVMLDIMEQRHYGKTSETYLFKLLENDGMITWSNHLIDELYEFYHRQKYNEEAKKPNKVPENIEIPPYKWLENNVSDKESAEYAEIVTQKVVQTEDYLNQFGVQFDPNPTEVGKLATKLYSNYGNNYKDSKHVAIATLAGTNNILTQDSGYLRFPHLNVFGASKAIVTNSNNVKNDINSFIDLREILEEEKKDKASGV